MIDFDKHFHTSLRPTDQSGKKLQPLDLVMIGDIPAHYYDDPDFMVLKEYAGNYGILTYFLGEPFYYGRKSHPGWTDGEVESVNVLSRRVCDDAICSMDFWIPACTLKKIPYNSLIMNVFADYPWQMLDDDGPSDHHFVVRGMEQFDHIERILSAPYGDLVNAHEAAMKALSKKT
jgi:hypothetical protein